MENTSIDFSIQDAQRILERTPTVLKALLKGLGEDWIHNNEGPETWSAFDIVGHLIHGERSDWLVRVNLILSNGLEGTFTPFDRFAQFQDSKGKNLEALLEEFEELRNANLKALAAMHLSHEQLDLRSNHPALGVVSMRQLLATWATHDLAHLNQMTRVLAKQYKSETGPWAAYISVLNG